MPTFRSPHNPNFWLKPGRLGRTLQFRDGVYETDDPEEVAILRRNRHVTEDTPRAGHAGEFRKGGVVPDASGGDAEPDSVAIRRGKYEGKRGYVAYNPKTGKNWAVFGSTQGGHTREEALYWAGRLASKNGLELKRPDGWEDVEAHLPERDFDPNDPDGS